MLIKVGIISSIDFNNSAFLIDKLKEFINSNKETTVDGVTERNNFKFHVSLRTDQLYRDTEEYIESLGLNHFYKCKEALDLYGYGDTTSKFTMFHFINSFMQIKQHDIAYILVFTDTKEECKDLIERVAPHVEYKNTIEIEPYPVK